MPTIRDEDKRLSDALADWKETIVDTVVVDIECGGGIIQQEYRDNKVRTRITCATYTILTEMAQRLPGLSMSVFQELRDIATTFIDHGSCSVSVRAIWEKIEAAYVVTNLLHDGITRNATPTGQADPPKESPNHYTPRRELSGLEADILKVLRCEQRRWMLEDLSIKVERTRKYVGKAVANLIAFGLAERGAGANKGVAARRANDAQTTRD